MCLQPEPLPRFADLAPGALAPCRIELEIDFHSAQVGTVREVASDGLNDNKALQGVQKDHTPDFARPFDRVCLSLGNPPSFILSLHGALLLLADLSPRFKGGRPCVVEVPAPFPGLRKLSSSKGAKLVPHAEEFVKD
jgi:hypothetical protein